MVMFVATDGQSLLTFLGEYYFFNVNVLV
jgi:hypothetical protein